MKARKLSLVLALVVLSAMLLAAPVQAGRTVTPFTFQMTDVVYELPKYVMTGPVGHFIFVAKGTVVSGDPRLDGGQLTITWHGPEVYPNPHPVILGTAWGPVPGKFEIILPGEPLAAWQGSTSWPPWSDPTKWPDTLMARGRGNGVGAYKNMHIEWRTLTPTQIPLESVAFSGEISENDK
jgi:hypothetical protein